MTLFQLNNLQAQIEGYIERHAEPPLTIVGDDTNANGFRLIVPNESPDVCGDLVRAIAPGSNMSLAVDSSSNIITLSASSVETSNLDGQMKGGGIVTVGNLSNTLAQVEVQWSQEVLIDLNTGATLRLNAFNRLPQYNIPFFSGSAGTYIIQNMGGGYHNARSRDLLLRQSPNDTTRRYYHQSHNRC